MNRTAGSNILVTTNRITESWVEGNGNGGGTTGATWQYRDKSTSTNWTTAGGTHNSPGNTITTAGGWNNWTVTSDVQYFTTNTNFGWLLECTTTGTSTSTFASEENGTTANRPALIIVWH